MVRKIKRMDGEEMYHFWKNMLEQGYTEGYEAGYNDGLTADLDQEAYVVNVDDVRKTLSDEAFLRLIGEAK